MKVHFKKMDLIYLYLISSLFISISYGASPVFLSDGGAKICTLNNVGTLPSKASNVKYPVYQKVCRQVVPTALGDQIEDNDEKDNDSTGSDDSKSKVSQLRRAIIQQTKK